MAGSPRPDGRRQTLGADVAHSPARTERASATITVSVSNIESVDIVFDEQLTLENRAGYYDRASALVDMIQSHLLQVLALTAASSTRQPCSARTRRRSQPRR